MSVVLRGFVTPWAKWTRRWYDVRMQPAKSPLWVADCGARDGVFVGPYVDPQGRVRDEVVFYPSMTALERELNVRPTDFAPWRPWLLASLVGDGAEAHVKAFTTRIEEAIGLLRQPMDRKAYIKKIIPIGIDLVRTIGDLRRGPPELPPEFKAKLAERDRFVDREAAAQLEELKRRAGSN